MQGDAIRNITGKFSLTGWGNSKAWCAGEGAFGSYSLGWSEHALLNTTDIDSGLYGGWNFDVSRVVPTANEIRPKNITLIACIKY